MKMFSSHSTSTSTSTFSPLKASDRRVEVEVQVEVEVLAVSRLAPAAQCFRYWFSRRSRALSPMTATGLAC